MLIRIGSRGSRLALTQAELAAERLRRPGVEIALVPITTAGDRDRTKPFGEIGSRGLAPAGDAHRDGLDPSPRAVARARARALDRAAPWKRRDAAAQAGRAGARRGRPRSLRPRPARA